MSLLDVAVSNLTMPLWIAAGMALLAIELGVMMMLLFILRRQTNDDIACLKDALEEDLGELTLYSDFRRDGLGL